MDTDRNLLFGVLALQAEMITPGQFVEACTAWAADKDVALSDLLVRRGWITPVDQADVERLLERKLSKHGSSVQASLAAVASAEVRSVLAAMRSGLATVNDPDLQDVLTALSPSTGPGAPPLAPLVPMTRQRYTLARLHASGGLGRVWLARDDDLGREVALKELRAERAHEPTSQAWFLKEARVTGQLEHPNIVPVYELGRRPEDGQPFYTMRFVKGRTLSEAAAAYHQKRRAGQASSLDLLALLNVFVAVCNAVAYAHSRGVVHRDLKGQNVILGDFGEVIVLDWGLAKMLDRPEAEAEAPPVAVAQDGVGTRTLEGQLVGTPAYMAPEQAAGRPERVDRRTDVYGLGAVLYELLTGQAPFAGPDLSEVLRQVQQEDPVRPRQTAAEVPRALEAVCLRALAKKPEERYASAQDLAREVQRWLADEPVQAYREPLLVRLQRWRRRHRPLVAAAAALLVTAVAALTASTYVVHGQQQATEAAREEAVRERERAERERDRANANFALARDAVDKTITRVAEDGRLKRADFHQLRRDLLASAVPFYEEFARQPGADAPLEAERGRAYERLGYVRSEMGEKEQAVEAYHQMRTIFTQLAADSPAEPGYRQKLASSHNNLGVLLDDLGQRADAEAAYGAALAVYERLAANFPGEPGYRQKWGSSYTNFGNLRARLGKWPEAEAAYGSALAIQQRLTDDFPTVAGYCQDLATSHNNLGALRYGLGKWAEADTAYGAARAIQQRLADDFPAVPGYLQDLARTHNNLGLLRTRLAKWAEAEADSRAAIGLRKRLADNFPAVPGYRHELATSHRNLGNLLARLGKRAEAEAAYRAALAIQQRLADDSPAVPGYRRDLAASHNNLGALLAGLEKWADGEAAYRAALTIQERLAGEFPAVPDHAVDLAHTYGNLGNLVQDSGQPQAALDWYAKAIARLEPILRTEPRLVTAHQSLRSAHGGRARALGRLGRHPEALRDWDRVLELAIGPERNSFRLQRALTLARLGDHDRTAAEADDLALATGVTAGTFHSLACVYALASAAAGKDAAQPPAVRSQLAERHAARAVESLAKAREAGFFRDRTNVDHLTKDPDLASLRSRADFQKLLRELAP